MKTVRVVAIVALSLLATAPSARAQNGSISFSFAIAGDPSIGGTIISAGQAGATTFTETGWKASHSTKSPLLSLGVGYTVAPRIEVVGGFEYGRAGSNLLTVGTLNGVPLNASFSPYQFWGLNAGLRAGLDHGRGAFGAAAFGFRRIDSIDATFTQPALTSTQPFYDGTTAPTFSFGGGYLFGGSTSVAFGFELDVKYTGGLTPAAASPTFSPVNGQSTRWSLPIGFLVRF